MNNPSVAAAFFDKAIDMFQSSFPSESLQEAREWREACLILMQEHHMFYRHSVNKTARITLPGEKSTLEVSPTGLSTPEEGLSNRKQSSTKTETPEKVRANADLKRELLKDSASGMAHPSDPSSSISSKSSSSSSRRKKTKANKNKNKKQSSNDTDSNINSSTTNKDDDDNRSSNNNIKSCSDNDSTKSNTPINTSAVEESDDSVNIKQLAIQNRQPGRVKDVKHHELKLKESIPGVEIFSNPENPHVQLTAEDIDDNFFHTWTFRSRFKVEQVNRTIPGVCLQYHHHHFYISRIEFKAFDKSNKVLSGQTLTLPSKASHHHSSPLTLDPATDKIEFLVEVNFQPSGSVTGSFIQRLLFDFGKDALLMKEFNIDVGSREILDNLREARQAVRLEIRPWDHRDAEMKRCKIHRKEEKLMSTYSLPEDIEKIVSVQMVDGMIRQNTYKQTMHQLLFAEEIYMRKLLLSLTPTKLKLHAMRCLDLGDGGIRYAQDGQLFGSIDLDDTPDDVAGRVCLRNCRCILIIPNDETKCIYEAIIEHQEGRKVVVNLTPEICNELKIEEDSIVDVCIRFNLNRVPHCVMHKAIDSLELTHILQLFPDKTFLRANEKKQKVQVDFRLLDPRLNECQKRVIQAIAEVVPPSPPLVVFGPFGTGKTFTLNQAVIYLMKEKANRVLLCTHTNSAADIHVELLNEHSVHKNEVLKVVRVYDLDTDLNKTYETVRKYALVKDGVFSMPTKEIISKRSVVITTLTTADLLTKLGVQGGFFTHILIDEAAQAWETEALIPLALAGPNTKVVFTGDHKQMNPEVYSAFAREKGLQQSLPERLFALYQNAQDPSLKDQYVFFLLDNYRSNKQILDFPSTYCYEGKIKAEGHADNPSHPDMGSLSFHTVEGREERQHDNTFLNKAEVEKVVELVVKLDQSWPECWGVKSLQDIAVVAAYGSQVRAIRDELRKQKLWRVNVETIHNVQGKEFRALLISTVRTRHLDLSSPGQDRHEDLSLQFLSDPKLLITAVTRAKSLVAVIGDPVALCTIGRCRSLWKDYITSCDRLHALYGTTRTDLFGRIGTNAILNPEAAPFVPGSRNDNDDSDSSSDTHETAENTGDSYPNEDLESDPNKEVDDIIKAFIKKFQEREAVENDFARCDENSLPGVDATGRRKLERNRTKTLDLKTLGCQYLIRRKNGREEILLLDLLDVRYERPAKLETVALNPEKQQDMINPDHSPEELRKKLAEDAERYVPARLHVGSDRFRTTYAVLQDKRKPDVLVKGPIRRAFDGDTVVIDLKPDGLVIEGNVGFFIGVLNQLADPCARQYVCEVDPKKPSVMIPINRSLPKIMNVSDKSCRDIPIYKKDERGKLDEVEMLRLQDALNEKNLFVVEFLKWREGFPLPLGCAVATIPRGSTPDTSQKILLTELGIREEFSVNIEKMVQKSVPSHQQVNRELSERIKITKAFTIDPPQAKDLDDAISVDEIGNGKYKVGVHIADVSYFVQRGSDLDREARQRGASYYPRKDGEINIPMLPRELSEDRLSLLPNQDRLTVSVFVTLNSEGEVVGETEIMRTVTRSCCRLSYFQAQKIIDKKKHPDLQDVPEQVRLDVKKLYSLFMKRRWQRLREAFFDHSNSREDTDAHELIEELMILVNHTVGDILYQGEARGTPFRIQDEPKVDRLNEWASSYGSYAKYSLVLKPHLESEDIIPEVRRKIESEENTITIKKNVWNKILKAAASDDYKQVTRLICDPFSSPQIATAWQNLMRIQSKAQYQAGVEHPYHYSLRLRSYVHFTSPIRRYIDIEVHRLLLALVQENGVVVRRRHEDEITELCQKATLVKEKSGKFEKESERISFATKLQRKNLTGMFAIDKIEEHAFTIQPLNHEQEQLLGNQKMITFDDLSPNSKKEMSDGTPGTTLMWRFRMYLCSGASGRSFRNFTRPKKDDPLEELKEDAKTITTMIENKYRFEVCKIEGETWMKIIDGIKKSAQQQLCRAKETIKSPDGGERKLKTAAETRRKKKVDKNTWMKIIGSVKESDHERAQHHVREASQLQEVDDDGKKCADHETAEHHVREASQLQEADDDGKKCASTEENVGHFFEVKWHLKQYDIICLQLHSRLHRGMICPDEQFFNVSPHFGICLEHHKDARGCFACHATGQINTMKVYETIQSYVCRWKPLLEMEAATGAVRQDDGYTLKLLSVSWREMNGAVKGEFTLTDSYCKKRQINFHRGDFTCVKNLCGADKTCTEFMDNEASTVVWIGHGVIEGCKIKEENPIEEDKGQRIVSFKILQMSSEFPQDLQDQSKRLNRIECDVNVIYQPLPLRRMNEALTVKLKKSSDLVKAICLGRKTPPDKFPPFPDPTAVTDLSLADRFEESRFNPLNEFQKKAVQQALNQNFLLIQGPPGTGKTVTGVHIAYWFAEANKSRPRSASPEESEPRLAPPQVLYCGPSNKSVDVVTEYLLRIPEMKNKILRVHGSLIQETEYPIPNKITSCKPTVSEDELKIPEGEVKEVSLHHFIRSELSPYAERLAEMEAYFRRLKEQGERVSDQLVKEYCTLISEAEKWAIQRTGKEIILCTCSRAGSKTIALCDNIQQCIIDECGMCVEPEVLVPMTSSEAKQFVLIGDHKQLQPIVMDRLAKTFGLQVSMFERLSNRALMLKIQYRMHLSICEFPSNRFYKGKLETPDVVTSRPTPNVQIWPAPNQRRVFCHVEGEEKCTVISTAESGVHSKYNEEEAAKAVEVAKYLVDNHGEEIKNKNVVILTPYREQRRVIQDLLKREKKNILVTTIIKSQGSEWDYVILSLVRSLPEQELQPEPSSSWLGEHLGFITDDHQINVALTRAKHGLIIIGNKKLLSYSSTWEDLIKQYEKKECVVEGKQWPSLPD